MEGVRVLFDASAYLLWEASGDSEAQYFGAGGAAEAEAGCVVGAAEDDAQSCIYGSWAYSGGGGADSEYDGRGKEVEEDGGGYSSYEEEEEEEEEDGVVDQWCGGGKEAPPPPEGEKSSKSQVCEDTNMKLMNDEEKDRLFWEACLAS